jgi:hypothetical protein
VPRVEYEKLSDPRLGEPSAAIQARVDAARQRQRERFDGTVETPRRGVSTTMESVDLVACNADMRLAEALQYRPRVMMG